jgi:uncharacterized protein YgiM (DUF1202 family)
MAKNAPPSGAAQRALPWLALVLLLAWMGFSWSQLNGEQESAQEVSGRMTTETVAGDESQAKKAKVLAPLLNFRAGPADNAVVISTLKQDTVVDVIEQQDDWLLVRSEDGKSGYVVNKPDFIELLSE